MSSDSFEVRSVEFDCPDLSLFLSHLRAVEKKTGCCIVLFDADRMAGVDHARCATRFALRSWEGGKAVAHTFDMEALLFAAATRQCGEALMFGIHPGRNHAYLVICPESPAGWALLREIMHEAAGWSDMFPPEKRAFLISHYGISDEELAVTGQERLKELVLERVALLWVNR